jgi:hypothetical protein
MFPSRPVVLPKRPRAAWRPPHRAFFAILLTAVMSLAACGGGGSGSGSGSPSPTSSSSSQPEAAVGVVPDELVGRWNGGPSDRSGWWLTFTADGHYSWVSEAIGFNDEGVAIVEGSTLQMHSTTGQVHTSQITLEPTEVGFVILRLSDHGGESTYIRG